MNNLTISEHLEVSELILEIVTILRSPGEPDRERLQPIYDQFTALTGLTPPPL